MRFNRFHTFILLLLSTTVASENVESQSEEDAVGGLDGIIIKILELLRPSLVEVHIQNQTFHTGPQEFGDLNGNVSDVTIEGLDKFRVKIIDTTLFDLNNLTLEFNFSAKGHYHIDGTLAFPLGKHDIHLFGDGDFSAEMGNVTTSVKLKIRPDNDNRKTVDFDILLELDKIQVYFKNLMGGGDLEQVFNQLMNDVGLTVFNYYKQPILNNVKAEITKILTDLLNKQDKNNIEKTEL